MAKKPFIFEKKRSILSFFDDFDQIFLDDLQPLLTLAAPRLPVTSLLLFEETTKLFHTECWYYFPQDPITNIIWHLSQSLISVHYLQLLCNKISNPPSNVILQKAFWLWLKDLISYVPQQPHLATPISVYEEKKRFRILIIFFGSLTVFASTSPWSLSFSTFTVWFQVHFISASLLILFDNMKCISQVISLSFFSFISLISRLKCFLRNNQTFGIYRTDLPHISHWLKWRNWWAFRINSSWDRCCWSWYRSGGWSDDNNRIVIRTLAENSAKQQNQKYPLSGKNSSQNKLIKWLKIWGVGLLRDLELPLVAAFEEESWNNLKWFTHLSSLNLATSERLRSFTRTAPQISS